MGSSIPKFSRALILFVLVFLVLPLQCYGKETISGTVVKVMDGDTLGLYTRERGFLKIRLYGIDAPEHGQAYGNRAKQALSLLVLKKNVSVIVRNTDQYGRLVGTVLANGKNINEQMVQNGYAWVYRWFCQEPEKSRWLELEKEAKNARRGLWSGKKPLPPWKWRQRHPR